jgi:hypothetical protein
MKLKTILLIMYTGFSLSNPLELDDLIRELMAEIERAIEEELRNPPILIHKTDPIERSNNYINELMQVRYAKQNWQ